MLTDFTDWISATDEHAATHLGLLAEAQTALTESPLPHHVSLAERLERWRYQLLKHEPIPRDDDARALIDTLDLTANRLAGRSDRAPRAPRQAEQLDVSELTALLDSETPLEPLLRQATELTQQSFGVIGAPTNVDRREMLLYAPLYLSSHCTNHCTYCGFRHPNEIERTQLSVNDALRQADILADRGFNRLLLVAGDFPRLTSTAYFTAVIRELTPRGFNVSLEIAAQSTSSYAQLVEAGATGVTLYQETYDEALYPSYHPRGSKALYDWRLEAYDRAAEAGMPQLGLGVLLGLADPKQDLLAMIRHGRYLQSRFPDVALAFSLPRIHEAPEGFESYGRIDDETFIRLYVVLRIAFPSAELVLSTREARALRDHLASVCITRMSAGSSTSPGGYEEELSDQPTRQQFPITDDRSPDEVAHWLGANGFDVRWD